MCGRADKKLLITIDGPAGSGKTTVSRKLAETLGYAYVDTGALYRGVAYEALNRGISPDDDAALGKLCSEIRLDVARMPEGMRLFSGDADITDCIRTEEISMAASAVSARPVVRNALFELQRSLGAEKEAVFEGRDMGTVVFPEADLKFFLTADSFTRAVRRYGELADAGDASIEEVAADMEKRDSNDSSREAAPLRPAPDAVIIDSTTLGVEEVVHEMMSYVKRIFDE